eukprot:CAMPEP_0206301006 /NCGR_PEP_ID=MMETSP0106_2-20121207/7993_1 /ASSEMBLY_ACC=CAM_ASM_000206 /TAXON_ID=81532 /ORGANISM="Acanthoeca-like sp., Strain 10tr" /LENGTH=1609 /DNA_ID=CAMNT_0053731745 /DNA_START=84 /DNA_END=4913 /DNA_ORIENTATION=-
MSKESSEKWGLNFAFADGVPMISSVVNGSPAERSGQLNDLGDGVAVVSINHHPVVGIDKDQFRTLVRGAGDSLILGLQAGITNDALPQESGETAPEVPPTQASGFAVSLTKDETEKWGLNFSFSSDGDPVVKSITPDTPAARCTALRELRDGLMVLSVNGIFTSGSHRMSKRDFATTMRSVVGKLTLQLQALHDINAPPVALRGDVGQRSLEEIEVTLHKDPGQEWGITLSVQGATVIISGIAAESIASQCADVQMGMVVSSIGGTSMSELGHENISAHIERSGNVLRIGLVSPPTSGKSASADDVRIAAEAAPVADDNGVEALVATVPFLITLMKAPSEDWGLSFAFKAPRSVTICAVAPSGAAARSLYEHKPPLKVLAISDLPTDCMDKVEFDKNIDLAGDILELVLQEANVKDPPAASTETYEETAQTEAATVVSTCEAASDDVTGVCTIREGGLYTRKDVDVEDDGSVAEELQLAKGDTVFVRARQGAYCLVAKVAANGTVGTPGWVPEAIVRKASSRASRKSIRNIKKAAEAAMTRQIIMQRPWPLTMHVVLSGTDGDDSVESKAESNRRVLKALGFAITSATVPAEGARASRRAKFTHLVTAVDDFTPAKSGGMQVGDRVRLFNKKTVDTKSGTALMDTIVAAVRNSFAITFDVCGASTESGTSTKGSPTPAPKSLAKRVPVAEQPGNEDTAAIKIQAAFRGAQARKKLQREEQAVIRIQAAARGHAVRKSMSTKHDASVAGDATEEDEPSTRDPTGDNKGTPKHGRKSKSPGLLRSFRKKEDVAALVHITLSPPFDGGLGFAISAKQSVTEGMRSSSRKNRLSHVVSTVVAGRPAANAGLREGHRIRLFNKKNVLGKSTMALQEMIAKAIRAGEEFSLCVTSPTDAERELDSKEKEAVQHAAAARIQAGFRGTKTRNRLKKEELAAIKLQAAVRGHVARKRILAVLTRDTTDTTWGLRMRYSNEDYPIVEYVVPGSPTAVGGDIKAGMSVLNIDGEVCYGINAAEICSLIGLSTKVRILARIPYGAPPVRASFSVDPSTRAAAEQQARQGAEEANAATKIQAAFRGSVVRRQHNREREAAIKLQAAARGHAARKRVITVVERASDEVAWGLHITCTADWPIITYTVPGSPAEMNGSLQAGMSLLEMNGQSVSRATKQTMARLMADPNRLRVVARLPAGAPPRRPSMQLARRQNTRDVSIFKDKTEKWGVKFGFVPAHWPVVQRVSATMAGARFNELAPGVHVTAIDGTSTLGIDIHGFADLLRGKHALTLTLLDDDALKQATSRIHIDVAAADVSDVSDEDEALSEPLIVPRTHGAPDITTTSGGTTVQHNGLWSNDAALAGNAGGPVDTSPRTRRGSVAETRRRLQEQFAAHGSTITGTVSSLHEEAEARKSARRRASKKDFLAKFNAKDEPNEVGSAIAATLAPQQLHDKGELAHDKPATDDRAKETFQGFEELAAGSAAASETQRLPTQIDSPTKLNLPKKKKRAKSALLPAADAVAKPIKNEEDKRGWFNTFRRKKMAEKLGELEARTVARTISDPPSNEFVPCKAGDVVHVIRDLPDGTTVIKTKGGRALLPAEAFWPLRKNSELDNINLAMFQGQA